MRDSASSVLNLPFGLCRLGLSQKFLRLGLRPCEKPLGGIRLRGVQIVVSGAELQFHPNRELLQRKAVCHRTENQLLVPVVVQIQYGGLWPGLGDFRKLGFTLFRGLEIERSRPAQIAVPLHRGRVAFKF